MATARSLGASFAPHRLGRALGLAFVVAACARPRATPADLVALEYLANVLGAPRAPLPDRALARNLAEGLTALDLGYSDACKRALREVGAASSRLSDYGRRAELIAAAMEVCRFACPRDSVAVLGLPQAQRTAAAIVQCAPEPVFRLPLAPQRDRLGLFDYVLLRELLGRVDAALVGDGSARALALRPRLAALVPPATRGLVEEYDASGARPATGQ